MYLVDTCSISSIEHNADHEDSARAKIEVPHAKALLTHGVTILPFTIDHLGGLGSFACSFLVGTSTATALQPAEKAPPWTENDFRGNLPAFYLYQQIDAMAPTALFPKADKTWRTATNAARYGSTYHTQFPSQWAMQALALNTSIALAKHILDSASANLTIQLRRRRIDQKTRKQSPPHPSPPIEFLSPSDTYYDIRSHLSSDDISDSPSALTSSDFSLDS